MVAGPLRPLRLRPPSPAPRYQPPVPAAATPLPRVVPGILGLSPRPPTPRSSSIPSPLGRSVSTPARAMYVHVHPSRFRSCRRPSGGTIVRMGSREGGEPPGTITTSEKRGRGSSRHACYPWRAFSTLRRNGQSRLPTFEAEKRKGKAEKGESVVVLQGASVTQKIKASSSSSSRCSPRAPAVRLVSLEEGEGWRR